MLKTIIKTSWRTLVKQKRSSFINIAGLSIGMTAAILIMLWVQNEVSYDNYHKDADRIYRITNNVEVNKGETWIWENSPMAYAPMAQKEIPEVEQTARIKDFSNGALLAFNGELFREKSCAYVDDNWFRMFHYKVLAGSITAFNSDPFSIAFTRSKAEKYFGTTNAIGQLIRIDTINYTVRAVLEDEPANSSFQYGMLLPLKAWLSSDANAKNDAGWNNYNYITFAKLHLNANKSAVEKKLTALLKQNKKDNIHSTLVGLADMHFETDLQSSAFAHTNKKTVTIFTVLAALLLLTACINYVNLTTARASLRSKEVSIRKIVGAAKAHLFWQFMAESLAISIVSMLITLLLVQVSLPFFNTLTDHHFILLFSSPGLWKIILGTIAFTTILNGIYPALLLSSFKPMNVFRGATLLKINDAYFRKGLVIVQFSISVILIVGTIVIFKQMDFIQKSSSSYNRTQIASVMVPWKNLYKKPKEEQASFIDALMQNIRSQSAVSAVSIAETDIINDGNFSSGNCDWNGRPKDFNPTIAPISADATFHKMFNLTLAEGRWYRDHDKSDEHSYILNETAVKELNIHKPVIGQQFIKSGDTGTIIGIVKDFHYASLHDKIGPMVMYNHPDHRWNCFIQVQPGQASNALASVKKIWSNLFPDRPFEYMFLDESFDRLYKNDRKVSALILAFSLIAVFISSLGLFGLAAFTAERKVKEIGIRKVLGASVSSIVGLLSKEFVYLVTLSIVIASPIGWLVMNKWLENFAYRVDLSAWIFLSAGLTAISIALFTVSIQAIRAARANPVKSLRTE